MHINTTTSAQCSLEDFLICMRDKHPDDHEDHLLNIKQSLTGHHVGKSYQLWERTLFTGKKELDYWNEEAKSGIYRIDCKHSELFLRLSAIDCLDSFLVNLANFVLERKIDRLELSFQWSRKSVRSLRIDIIDQGEDGKTMELSMA